MKNNPLISVIIPLYNNGNYIIDCLKSVSGQSYNNLEIIVINDGSTDNSGIQVEEYAEKEKRLRIFHQENKGVSAARNKGIKNAKGSYISFIDSDDTINLHGYFDFVKIIEKTDADIILSDIIYCYDDGSKYQIGNRGNLFENKRIMSGVNCFSRMMQNECYIPMVCNNIYKTEFLLKNNLFFPPFLHEDEFFTPKAFFYAEKVSELNLDFYYYRQTTSSIMRSDNEIKRSQAKINVCLGLIEFMEINIKKGNSFFSDWLSVRLMQLLHIVYFQIYKLREVSMMQKLITPPFLPNLMGIEMIKENTLQAIVYKKEFYGITTQLRKIHLFFQNEFRMK